MQELRALCTKYEACLILDEIQSGYGRSGKFFAHQYAGIKPDLISVAKGIGNGFPMSGLLISPMFKPVYGMLGTTFGGNHLACAAAIAVLEIMEDEKLIDNAREVGAYLLDELHKLPGIKDAVRREGIYGSSRNQHDPSVAAALSEHGRGKGIHRTIPQGAECLKKKTVCQPSLYSLIVSLYK